LLEYVNYGANNPSTFILSTEELKAIKADDLIAKIHNLKNYKHKIFYYGSASQSEAKKIIEAYHQAPSQCIDVPPMQNFKRAEMNENKVYFVDFPMVQAEIMWSRKSGSWSEAQFADVRLFNEYFGGSMSGLVFQTIRESKALAYSTTARYAAPSRKEDPFYMSAYVGTQADKLNEATAAMNELLNNMPQSEKNLQLAKDAISNQIESERILKTNLFFSYQSALKLGANHDLRKDVYTSLNNLSMNKVAKFHSDNLKNKTYSYAILASSKKVNKTDLEKLGTVQELKLEDIFGY
jgi:predicted Zn-dependent peptidase